MELAKEVGITLSRIVAVHTFTRTSRSLATEWEGGQEVDSQQDVQGMHSVEWRLPTAFVKRSTLARV